MARRSPRPASGGGGGDRRRLIRRRRPSRPDRGGDCSRYILVEYICTQMYCILLHASICKQAVDLCTLHPTLGSFYYTIRQATFTLPRPKVDGWEKSLWTFSTAAFAGGGSFQNQPATGIFEERAEKVCYCISLSLSTLLFASFRVCMNFLSRGLQSDAPPRPPLALAKFVVIAAIDITSPSTPLSVLGRFCASLALHLLEPSIFPLVSAFESSLL